MLCFYIEGEERKALRPFPSAGRVAEKANSCKAKSEKRFHWITSYYCMKSLISLGHLLIQSNPFHHLIIAQSGSRLQ